MDKHLLNIKTLPLNTVGRDFVVGDIHGCFKQLQKAMLYWEFNKTVDRLFSVGDMVDRGPSSEKVLRLLGEPWFYPVMGNHEAMLVAAVEEAWGIRTNTGMSETCFWMQNGGLWAEQLLWTRDSQCMAWRKELAALPTVYVVGDIGDPRTFCVVHAELWHPRKHMTVAQMLLASPDDREDLAEIALWSRKLMMGKQVGTLPTDVSKIFCGHTPSEDPRLVETHYGLDTGAGRFSVTYPGGLTMLEIGSLDWVKVRPDGKPTVGSLPGPFRL